MKKVRRCGNSWACCDGNCDSCPATHTSTTNRTEPAGPMYTSKISDLEDDVDYDPFWDDDGDCTCFD